MTIQTQPLWSDERISKRNTELLPPNALLLPTLSYWQAIYGARTKLMFEMRDDYEAALTEGAARISELITENGELREKNGDLRGQLVDTQRRLDEAKQRAFVGESWSETVDYLRVHTPEPEPQLPEPPDDWDEEGKAK